MKKFFGSIWSYVKGGWKYVVSFATKHKIVAGVIVLAIIGGGYWAYTAIAAGNGGSSYVLSAATRGPLQVTVTGSGQVAANDQLALTPQASGQVTEINVTTGQTVKAGQVIARIDDTTAYQAVQSAQSNLESAQISYQQAIGSSQTGLSSDQTSIDTDINTTYSNLPAVMVGLDGVLHSFSTVQGFSADENVDAYESYINSSISQSDHQEVVAADAKAVSSYQTSLALYNASNSSTLSAAQAEQLAQSSIATLNDINTAITDTLSYYNYINTQVSSAHLVAPAQLATQITSLNSYESTVAGDISSLTSAENALQTDTQTSTMSSSNETLTQQSAQLNLQKAQEALDQAEQTESNYVVTAPFDGTIANVAVKKFDQASSGTTVATLITPDEYADLSLNETDAAKVHVGQAASLTFDALATTTMQGTVATVSGIGTVSQGVVTYDVKIGFNTQNSSIKPGMTANATIITASSTNAIQVPSAAVKTASDGSSYVEVATFTNGSSTTSARRPSTSTSTTGYRGAGGFGGGSSTPSATGSSSFGTRSITVPAANVTIKNVPVTIGLSNDTMVEITSGLSAQQLVVTNTTTGSATTKTASSGNLLSSLFGGGRRTTTGTSGTSATRSSSAVTNGPTSGATGGGPPGGG